MTNVNPDIRPPSNRMTAALASIRIAYVAGLLMFGAVIWFLYSRPGHVAPAPDTPFGRILPFLLPALLVSTIAMRFVAAKQVEDEKRGTMLIIGWSIGEAAALAGGVHYLLTGNPRWYLAGMFVFLFGLVLLPLKRG